MMLQVRRFAYALMVALAAYTAYAFTVVPFVEPSKVVREEGPDEAVRLPSIEDRAHATALFQPTDWESQSPKVLEAEQGMLFLRDYEELPEGRIKITPCTLVVFAPVDEDAALADADPTDKKLRPAGKAASDQSPAKQRAFIVRAPEGAILEFDRRMDMNRPNMGRLTGGRLLGDVRIDSPESAPGEDDAVQITTRLVQINRERIWTTHEVRFQFGPHRGAGRDLTISLEPQSVESDLDHHESPAEGSAPAFRGVRFLELVHVDELELQAPAGKGLLGDEEEAAAAPGDAAATSPVEVACLGPFQFDFVKRIASFEDQVDVLRASPNGPSDQLNCERLEIHLGAGDEHPDRNKPPNKTPANAPAAGEKSVSGLSVRKIVAFGQPVILRAPASDASGRGDRLEYDFDLQEVSLEGARQAMFQQGTNRIEARKLRYALAARGQLGLLRAAGPGKLTASEASTERADNAAAERNNGLIVSWQGELFLRPSEGGQLVSLSGGAAVITPDAGGFSAREIHLWFHEVAPPRGLSTQRTAAYRPAAGRPRNERATTFQPDRMLATGNVDIDTAQLAGKTQQLEIWFEGPPTAADGRQSVGDLPARDASHSRGESRSPLGLGMGASSEDPEKSRRRYEVAGRLIQVQLVAQPDEPAARTVSSVSGAKASKNKSPSESYAPREIIIEGGAHFGELTSAGEQPLSVSGDLVHAQRLDTEAAFVRVTAATPEMPARVSAQGMTIAAGNLQLDQGENRMWIDGPGEMTFPPPRVREKPSGARPADGMSMPTRPAAPVTVSWIGRLNFDGRLVHLEKQVVVQSGPSTLRCGTLDAATSRRIDFSNADAGEEAELRHLDCSGGVDVENRAYDELGELRAIEELHTRNLRIDQLTGELGADGAGWLATVRREAPRAVSNRPAPTARGAGLTYLRVDFERGLTGNHLEEKRHIAFHEQVQAVHGPVSDWNGRLNPDEPGGLGEKGVVLTCDELKVTELAIVAGATQSADKPIEIEAAGNTFVESTSFTARAARLTYAMAKDMLVLEGDGRSEAEIWRRSPGGGPGAHTAARKMTYVRGRDHLILDSWDSLDITGIVPREKKP